MMKNVPCSKDELLTKTISSKEWLILTISLMSGLTFISVGKVFIDFNWVVIITGRKAREYSRIICNILYF